MLSMAWQTALNVETIRALHYFTNLKIRFLYKYIQRGTKEQN